MSVWVVVIGTWYHLNLKRPSGHKGSIFTEKYVAVQVRLGEVVLLSKIADATILCSCKVLKSFNCLLNHKCKFTIITGIMRTPYWS